MRRPGAQTLAALAVVIGLAVVTLLTARPQSAAGDSFGSDDYGSSGYRAWAALLAREGSATARFRLRPIELDAATDTLISAQPPSLQPGANPRTAADIGALAAWVRAGGRLVYVGRNAGAVGTAESKFLELPLLLPDVGARGRLSGAFANRVRRLDGLGTNRMLLVEHAGTAPLADGNGAIVVRYALGRGEITAVVDGVPFTNGRIAGGDNARLAYLLGRPRPARGVVAFDDALHGALVDRPWYRALPVPVLVGLAIGFVALGLGLIGSALRSGPPLRLEAAREPTSAEFVEALAALYERTSARGTVRTILARDALAAAARSLGLPADTAPDVLLARSRDRDDLRRLVESVDAPLTGDAELIASAKLAYALRKDSTHAPNRDGRRAAFAGRARAGRRR